MIKNKFKETEIGTIPEDWEVKVLSKIVNIIGGGTPKTSKPEYWGGDIPWISVADFVGSRRWIQDTEKHITKKGLEESSTSLLRGGQLIISARGTVGEIGQVTRDMAFNQSCYGIDGKDGVINDFLYYLLRFKVRDVQSKTHGSVFSTITRQTFDQILVAIPNISEQHSIASILGSLDSKIALNRSMNSTLEAIGQALFKHWFVDFEFPNEEGKPYRSSGGEMADSELGEVPKGWRVGTFGELIENFDSKRIPLSSRERMSRKGTYPYYGATSVMDYIDDYIFDGIYILMGEDGTVIDEKEHPVLQYIWGKFWVNNHAHVLKGKDGIPTEYILLLLKQMNIKRAVTGAVQPKINQANMNSLTVLIPPKETLNSFSKLIIPIFEQYRVSSEEVKYLSVIRDSLLPKLMSGEIRASVEVV